MRGEGVGAREGVGEREEGRERWEREGVGGGGKRLWQGGERVCVHVHVCVYLQLGLSF